MKASGCRATLKKGYGTVSMIYGHLIFEETNDEQIHSREGFAASGRILDTPLMYVIMDE